jgi:hypothetical protein
VYVVGGLGAGAFCVHEYKTLFASGRNKKGADTAAAAAQTTQAQAVIVKDSAADVAYAVAKSTAEHAVVIATRDAIDQNAAGFIEGAKDAVQSDPTPTQAEIIALVMLDSASDSLGQPLTLKQKKAWMETVGGLIAKNADTEAKLAKQTSDAIALRASLDATQAHAKAADDTSVALTAQLSAKATELVNEAKKSSDLAAKNKEWADNEPSLWARIKALCWLLGIAVAGLVYYEIKRKGLTGTLHDAVALAEHTKTIAVTATNDAPAIEAKIDAWWGDAKADAKKIEAVKQTLRL